MFLTQRIFNSFPDYWEREVEGRGLGHAAFPRLGSRCLHLSLLLQCEAVGFPCHSSGEFLRTLPLYIKIYKKTYNFVLCFVCHSDYVIANPVIHCLFVHHSPHIITQSILVSNLSVSRNYSSLFSLSCFTSLYLSLVSCLFYLLNFGSS